MGMTDTPYNIPPLGLFGKRCRILTGYDKRPFVYRIVNSEWMSNTWCEPPITYQSGRNPVRHDHSENVLIVVLDTLINENSRLIRVALKDVELMDEVQDNAGWISVKDRMPEYNGEYIVHFSASDAVLSAYYFKNQGGFRVATNIVTDSVLHWMPLPEPPKENEYA